MELKKLLKILSAMFAMRAAYFQERGDHSTAVAYDNAFHMLAYAASGNWDCLAQFGWSDEAEDLISQVGADVDFWKLEELIKGN